MFQSFETSSEGHLGAARLMALREEMSKQEIDWLIVFHADEHQNEYLPARAERLAWLTGFTGSAGLAIIGREEARLFVDGRYTLQAADQVDADAFSHGKFSRSDIKDFLSEQLSSTDTLGFDQWTTTIEWAEWLNTHCERTGAATKALENHPIDEIWTDQPDVPVAPVKLHPLERAGVAAHEKIAQIEKDILDAGGSALLVTDPTTICWLFNIRGNDIPKTPLTLCWCILRPGHRPQLFIKRSKLNIEVQAYLTQLSEIEPMASLTAYLEKMSRSVAEAGGTILLDKNRTAQALLEVVEASSANWKHAADPIVARRAVKNETEIAGTIEAHRRDGAAITEFLYWLSQQPAGSVDEITCAQTLETCRRNMGEKLDAPLVDIAFDTISAAGPNAALPHYRVNTDTNRTVEAESLYLVDSGAQYADGTTDITRTVAIGSVDEERKDRFTRVLKGHIAVQQARFPKGTKGNAIDPLARSALWDAGLDFAHGTGHGVGVYMSVHEGPQSISPRGEAAIEPGMITSNEPGYYKEGHYGIRIENLELARGPDPIEGGDQPMMWFETLTLCPIDVNCIAIDLMTDDELNWLNEYHARVAAELAPLVSSEAASWLETATAPIYR
jgi:Xaa-Pro aminopeptidase